MLRRPVIGPGGQQLGRLFDVIVRLPDAGYPLVTGLVADLGGRRVFLPAGMVTDWHSEQVVLGTARVDLLEFERRDGEVLLRADILGHRLIDIPRGRLVRAHDLDLAETPQGWVLVGVDTRPSSWWRRLLGTHEQHTTDNPAGDDSTGGYRDWRAFEALIGHEPTMRQRRRTGRLRWLKPAQIADLLEQASHDEQTELLADVHADPELEADVFEELDEDRQSQLLRDRPDPEIAAVLTRMRADDAADAIADLPQDRRKPVLDLLPAGPRAKVTALLGYNPATAGGLMGLDYLALPRGATAAAALDRVRTANTLQPESLSTVFTVNTHGKLRGAVGLVALLQAAPTAPLRAITDPDPDPVRVHPDADLIDITLLMTDYNLLNLPVVDDTDHLIGVIRRRRPGNLRAPQLAAPGTTPQPDPTDNQDDDIEDDRATPEPTPARPE